jgi:DNA-binding response OmpR family regulator
LNRIRLLVAEDDAPLRQLMAMWLGSNGFDVVTAADGAEALSLFREHGPFSALVLDNEMPHVSGRELLSELREARHATPALIVSGNLQLTEQEQARLAVGPVLRKPFRLRELVDAIRTAMRSTDATEAALRH